MRTSKDHSIAIVVLIHGQFEAGPLSCYQRRQRRGSSQQEAIVGCDIADLVAIVLPKP